MFASPYYWWVQSVMPVVFDNSLSYYEVLAKLTNYMQGVINDVDQIEKILATIDGIEDVTQFVKFLETIQAEIGTLSNLSTSNKSDLVSAINEVAQKANNAYIKPVTGIPEEDLSQEVRSKLNNSGGSGDARYIINNVTLKQAPSNNSPAELGLGTYTVPEGGIPEDTLSQAVREKLNSGGGGGITDYTELTNKPQINGHTLNAGNNSSQSLGLGTYSLPDGGIPESDLSADVANKLNTSGSVAPENVGMIAQRNYEIGELVYIDGVLYKVTMRTLTGSNFVVGNNIVVTDINDELYDINTKIDKMASGEGLDSWALSTNLKGYGVSFEQTFFEYIRCTGGEDYLFIVNRSKYGAPFVLKIYTRDGTLVDTQTADNTSYNDYRFTFTPEDTGDYYCAILMTASGTDNAYVTVTLEYTQSQGISELWNQVNQVATLEPRVEAVEGLVAQQQEDIEELNSLPTRISGIESDVDNLESDVDTIISIIDELPAVVPELTLEQGAISSTTGRPTASTSTNFNKRIRTDDFIDTNDCTIIAFQIPDDYWATIAEYNTNADAGYIKSTSAFTGYNLIVCESAYIKITFGRADNETFTPTDFPFENMSIKFVSITDKTLSISGAPADAKAVGDANLINLKFSAYDGGEDVVNQTDNTVCIVQTRNKEGLPFNFKNYSRQCVLITTGGVNKIQILMSFGTPKAGIFIKSSGVAWKSIEQKYNLYPTGDDTDRTSEIAGLLNYYDAVNLAPGEYYINALNVPANKKLIGCGEECTKLIYKNDNNDTYYAILLNAQSEVRNLSVKMYHSEAYAPADDSYDTGVNGIQIGVKTGSDTNSYETTIDSVLVEEFTGCGIFLRNIGQAGNGSVIKNVRVYKCCAGIYLGRHAEYNNIESSYCIRCFLGIVVSGGNNIINSCVFCENEINCKLARNDNLGAGTNDGHGIINSCKFTHAGFYSSNYPGDGSDGGYDIYSTDMVSAEIISNCFIGYPIYFEHSSPSSLGQPVMIEGCEIRERCTIYALNSKVILLSCMIENSDISITNGGGGTIKLANCFDYNFTSKDNSY